MSRWRELGIHTLKGARVTGGPRQAGALPARGLQGPGVPAARQFQSILKYNNSTAYGLAVGLLADRLKGAPPITAPWPREERPLTSDERHEMQGPAQPPRLFSRRGRRDLRLRDPSRHQGLSEEGRAAGGTASRPSRCCSGCGTRYRFQRPAPPIRHRRRRRTSRRPIPVAGSGSSGRSVKSRLKSGRTK